MGLCQKPPRNFWILELFMLFLLVSGRLNDDSIPSPCSIIPCLLLSHQLFGRAICDPVHSPGPDLKYTSFLMLGRCTDF